MDSGRTPAPRAQTQQRDACAFPHAIRFRRTTERSSLGAMQTLHIVAASPESGRALIEALGGFDAELTRASDGTYAVTVRLNADHQETIQVLNVLEQYVAERAQSAQITLNGREYTMEPEHVA